MYLLWKILKWKAINLVQWTPVFLPYRFINCEHLPFFPLSHTYTSVLLLFGFFFFFAELLWSKLQTCNSLSLNTSASIIFFFKIFWCGPILKSLLNLLQRYICLMFWIFGPKACGILGPWPRIEPPPFALEGKIWTTGPSGKSQQGSFKSKDLLWLNHIAMIIFRKCNTWTLLYNTGSILRCFRSSDVGSQTTFSYPVLSVHFHLGWFLAFLYHSWHWLLKEGCRPTVLQNVLLFSQNIPQFKLCIFVIPSKYYTGSPSLKYFIIFPIYSKLETKPPVYIRHSDWNIFIWLHLFLFPLIQKSLLKHFKVSAKYRAVLPSCTLGAFPQRVDHCWSELLILTEILYQEEPYNSEWA